MRTLTAPQTPFCVDRWPLQQTFKTPLQDLNRFVAAFLAPYSLQKGTLSTMEVVFKPKNLLNLLNLNAAAIENQNQFTIEAIGGEEIAGLLEAALSDWIDFVFVPCPELFIIYADHDEYTTFCTRDSSAMVSLVSSLESERFAAVLDYERR